ncbi:hypothetical protein SDC9_177330 [bioreactor metagenome]|uniref:Uncharacterized protein n=1 Tax=bioreactor metagenome TaxID=1076179 RepID=A0A645GSJ2_9ZZZZ
MSGHHHRGHDDGQDHPQQVADHHHPLPGMPVQDRADERADHRERQHHQRDDRRDSPGVGLGLWTEKQICSHADLHHGVTALRECADDDQPPEPGVTHQSGQPAKGIHDEPW